MTLLLFGYKCSIMIDSFFFCFFVEFIESENTFPLTQRIGFTIKMTDSITGEKVAMESLDKNLK